MQDLWSQSEMSLNCYVESCLKRRNGTKITKDGNAALENVGPNCRVGGIYKAENTGTNLYILL